MRVEGFPHMTTLGAMECHACAQGSAPHGLQQMRHDTTTERVRDNSRHPMAGHNLCHLPALARCDISSVLSDPVLVE